MNLPKKIMFVDVETTGLSTDDKIVSFGAVELDTSTIGTSKATIGATHLLFDPGVPSHPMAFKVHGYNDWTLRHQEPFPIYARCISSMISQCDLLVAHNSDFDLRFLSRELAFAREPWPNVPTYCTMQTERRLGLPSSLDAACKRIGIPSRGRRHSAFDDAFRAMQVFLYQHHLCSAELTTTTIEPSNYRKTPRKPKLGIPDRSPETELARIENVAKGLAILRQAILPALLVLRWIGSPSVEEEERFRSVLGDFAESEAAICGITIENFSEIAVRDTQHSRCGWTDVCNALDTIRSDMSKRRRLRNAIEQCIRSDGEISQSEIVRLRQVADYLGGQIAA